MFHSDLLRNKKFLIPLYLILISMFSNNILAKSQLDLESNILNPKDAFKMKIIDSDNYLSLNWEIEKNYYIYKNSINQVKEQISREPKPLPRLSLPNINSLDDIKKYKVEDFILENYHPHPPIKAKMAI